jgi:hypothetical protein
MSKLKDPNIKSNNWDIFAPTFHFTFSAPPSVDASSFAAEMLLIPGVKSKSNYWEVPTNAASLVDTLRKKHGLSVSSIVPGRNKPLPDAKDEDWATVCEIMVRNGVRPEYLDTSLGFPLPFQKDGILLGWNRMGISYWYSTGAGKSYTSIMEALRLPGLVVFVTRSGARIQMMREIERFTTTRAFVLRAPSQLKTKMMVEGKTWTEFMRSRMPELGKIKQVAAEWESLKSTVGGQRVFKTQTLDEYMEKRKEAGEVPFVIVGWEALPIHLAKLTELKPTTIIFDEIHLGKGSKRNDRVILPPLPDDPVAAEKQRKAEEAEAKLKGGFIKESDEGGLPIRSMYLPVMNRAAAGAILARHARRRICMTGSPTAGFVRDLWAQLDMMEPNAWGNKTAFHTRYCDLKQGPYGMVDKGTSNLEELMNRIMKTVHRVPMHISQAHLLGKKRRQSIYVAPEDQNMERAGFNAELKAAAKRGPTAVLEARLAQASTRKRTVGVELVSEHLQNKQKVVVFTARKKDCMETHEAIRKKNEGVTVIWANGDMNDIEKQVAIDEYMKHPGPCCLVATGQALGTSINLDDTDAAYFIMLPYDPISLKQWEGRFVRLSMKRAVVIYYLIAEGTIDEHVASLLIDKLPLVEIIADDQELSASEKHLAGIDRNESSDEFAAAILALIDE